jgi:hypothetical protein
VIFVDETAKMIAEMIAKMMLIKNSSKYWIILS